MMQGGDGSADGEVACTSTGYHLLSRRAVTLRFTAGQLSLTEDGRTRMLGRAECRPLMWVGRNQIRPLYPLPALALESERGEWIVGSADASVGLADANEQESPAPHVWVSGHDLARLARACGIAVSKAEVPHVSSVMPSRTVMLAVGGVIMAISVISSVVMINRPAAVSDCSLQKPPRERLYPRLSCQEARDELARVARGEAEPRVIVVRPTALTIDARDIVGPAKLLCDGVELPVIDAQQADPGGPIVYNPGPHSVLAAELASGDLRVSQYSICSDIVGRERR
jgi:hypothetical protein